LPKKNLTLQRLRRWIVYWGARGIQAISLILPFDLAVALGAWLGRLAFALHRRARRETIEHLTLAFGPEKTPEEIRDIARRVFINTGCALAEIMLSPRWSDERLRQRIQADEPAALLEASRSGRGVVILGAHFDNWELLGSYGVRILGLNAGVIVRALSNPRMDQMVNEYRRSVGLKVFVRGDPKGARGFYRHLIRGGTLALLGDHDMSGVEGIFVDFFGRPSNTATGPAELILRSKADWFFAVLVRQPDGLSHRLHVEGPLPIPDGDDYAARVRLLTEDYTHRVEAIVRQFPDQWMWMHNRWRKKPKKRGKAVK